MRLIYNSSQTFNYWILFFQLTLAVSTATKKYARSTENTNTTVLHTCSVFPSGTKKAGFPAYLTLPCKL